MKNQKELLVQIKTASQKLSEGHAFIIQAESGLGKSYMLNDAIELLEKDMCTVSINGKRTPGGARLDCFYEGVWEALHKENFDGSMWMEIVGKYASNLPGFSTFVAPLIEGKNFKAIEFISKKSGFSFPGNSAPHAAEFIRAIANKKKKIVLVIDDCQWIDVGTWNFISFLLGKMKQYPWLVIISINSSVSPHRDIEHIPDSLNEIFLSKSANKYTRLYPERWDTCSIADLVARICDANECNLSLSQAEALCSITDGIPKYVEIVVNTLLNDGHLNKHKGVVRGIGNWNNLDIPKTLQKLLLKELDLLYRKISDSRQTLQIACVVGEVFSEDMVRELTMVNEAYSLLKDIELHSQVIEDLHKSNKWKFRHTLNHRTIYQSIGERVKDFHFQIAEYMCNKTPDDFEAIAYHFRFADKLDLAIEYDLKSVESMLTEALFYPALYKVKKIIDEASIEITFNEEIIVSAKVLEGRAYFYLNKFYQAIEIFSNHIHKETIESEAAAHRWLGRCYLSMTTQKDFKRAIEYLSKSKDAYEKIENKEILAEVLSELSVAYEHYTDFTNMEFFYKMAEEKFHDIKDEIGINRLYRRSGMVLDGEISSMLTEKAAHRFRKWKHPHEEVMCLNNSAVAYLYCGNNKKFYDLLCQAQKVSMGVGDFGLAHLLVNQSIYFLLSGDLNNTSETLRAAHNVRERDSTNMVMDIMEGAFSLKALPFPQALAKTEQIYDKCIHGEFSYLIPSLINYAKALELMGELDLAISEMEKISLITLDTARNYIHCQESKWLRYLIYLYNKKNLIEKSKCIIERYSWCDLNLTKNISFYNSDFGAVPPQFWDF